jgi:hypothetical protein
VAETNLDNDPVEIVRRVDFLKSARSSLDSLFNDVERYIMPFRLGDQYLRPVSENAIRLVRDDVYDSTAIHAAQRMANAMHGSITNPAIKWRSRQWKDRDLQQSNDAVGWLQAADEIEWGELYQSNFDEEISSAYQDLVGPGNCFMSIEVEDEDDWKGFNFQAIPIKEAFFERDHRGDMWRFYRWFNWRASEIKSRFPNETKLPDVVMKALAEGGNPDTRFDVIYAIYVRPGVKYSFPLAGELRPVGCQYVFKDTKERIGKLDGFYEMPVFHCPWERTSGSAWGHGPGMIMSPTVKYINYWMELEDMAVRKMIDPPILAEERGIISDLMLKPGGVTVVRRIDSIKALLAEGRIDFSKMSLKELRDQVREGFHNDELQLKDSPQMSATEAQIRYELMNRVLGPTQSLIHNQLLVRILDRTFKSLLRGKQFPEVPDIIKKKQAANVKAAQPKVFFTGALQRAQVADEVASMERWMGQIGAVAKVVPGVLNIVDIMEWGRDMAVKLGIPMKVIRTVQEAQKLAEAQAQAAAAQAKAAIQKGQGEADQADAEGKKAQREAV